MGRISGLYAAAQNIICTVTTISFMIPLAISNATAVKVGFANGAKQFRVLKKYALSAIGVSVAFMTCSAIVFGVAPGVIMSLFTKDINLIKICVPIVYTLCFFQIFDGLQVSLAGIFRGLKQTKIVMISNFIAHWLIAIPIGYVFAINLKLNLLGFWYGLIFASMVLCAIMGFDLRNRFKKMKH